MFWNSLSLTVVTGATLCCDDTMLTPFLALPYPFFSLLGSFWVGGVVRFGNHSHTHAHTFSWFPIHLPFFLNFYLGREESRKAPFLDLEKVTPSKVITVNKKRLRRLKERRRGEFATVADDEDDNDV